MSKSLRSMTHDERVAAIIRRIDRKSGGLGYWAAVDAMKKTMMQKRKSRS